LFNSSILHGIHIFRNKLVRSDIDYFLFWWLFLNFLSNSLKEMCLTKTNIRINKERIIQSSRLTDNCFTRRIRKLIAWTNDEVIKSKSRWEIFTTWICLCGSHFCLLYSGLRSFKCFSTIKNLRIGRIFYLSIDDNNNVFHITPDFFGTRKKNVRKTMRNIISDKFWNNSESNFFIIKTHKTQFLEIGQKILFSHLLNEKLWKRLKMCHISKRKHTRHYSILDFKVKEKMTWFSCEDNFCFLSCIFSKLTLYIIFLYKYIDKFIVIYNLSQRYGIQNTKTSVKSEYFLHHDHHVMIYHLKQKMKSFDQRFSSQKFHLILHIQHWEEK